MNTHDLNDELLTQYVLGELTEDETRAVKEALMANPEARKTVAELEATVGMMKEALGGEAVVGLGLGEERTERITTEAQSARRKEKNEKKPWGWGKRALFYGGPLAVAASALVVAGLYIVAGQAGVISSPLYILEPELKTASNLTPPAVAGTPDPAATPSDGLHSPMPDPYRYSQTHLTEAAAAPASPRTEADAAMEKKAEYYGEAKDLGGVVAGVNLRSDEWRGQETTPQQQGDPQNVEVGGQVRIRANYYDLSESLSQESSWVEQRTRLSEKAASPVTSPAPAPAAEPVPSIAESIQVMPAPPKPEPKREQRKRDLVLYEINPRVEQHWNYRSGNSGEGYNAIVENPFKPVANEPLSTFSIDVDTGSYSNVRRFLESGSRPPADAVRIEELINYFDYDYPSQAYAPGVDPFSAAVSVAACPWAPGHKLVRVGVQGAAMPEGQRPASNLVFLLDVSGSMQSEDKLPLLQQGLQMLVNQLGENDRVSIVVYAGSSGMVLPPTNGSNKQAIQEAIGRLSAGGSTNGAGGIQQAYQLARETFIEGGVNRVILATDGDFNVGVTSQDELIRLITEQAKSKVFLTVLGFGTGNLQDGMMEQLANKGNGMYAYIDSMREAKKVFVEQVEGSLITIAKDVKIQIEFNPAHVQSYRLIGYENRALAAQDFNDDTKDAGEIGAGHTVTALYEIVPVGSAPQPGVDPLKYQEQAKPAPTDTTGELMTLKLRYKQPEGDVSKLLEFPIADSTQAFEQADADFRFASSVAAFGMLLRGSAHAGSVTWDNVQSWAASAQGNDPHGYRAEFLDLARKAAQMR
jgi:Ca-activated chloride channel family protein